MKESAAQYGAHYFPPGSDAVYEPSEEDTYFYRVFVGEHEVNVERGDSVWYFELGKYGIGYARVLSGPALIRSSRLAVVIRGYMAEEHSARVGVRATVLPYVNGCSTREIFSPSRLGDPTLQHLRIPAFSKEQAHHTHSTARVVYVARGLGKSMVGMEGKTFETDLIPGMVCVLDPFCPHHFETPQGEDIEVYPLHVWSSTIGEQNHPMWRGTHMMDQGG